MKVISKKSPTTFLMFNGVDYQFRDGVCEMPDDVALRITQINPDYSLDRGSMPVANFIPFNPDTWTKDHKKLIWDGPIGFNNGYGCASMMYIEGLNEICDLRAINGQWHGTIMDYASKNLLNIINKPIDAIDSFYVKFFPANNFGERIAERFIGYTMLEASKIPNEWVNIINERCERVIVPCNYMKTVFEECGVKRHVQVVPLGLWLPNYPIHDRTRNDNDFVFGILGTLTIRKGTDLLVRAFDKTFPKDKYPNVHVYIKTLGEFGANWAKTAVSRDRISINNDAFSPEDKILEFYDKIDCFVFPTRGEGFGLPPLEAMSVGVPVICTNYSGPADFMDESYSYPIGYKMAKLPPEAYPDTLKATNQMWAEPNFDELCDRMLEVYTNRKEANRKAKLAMQTIREEYSVINTGKQLLNYLSSKF